MSELESELEQKTILSSNDFKIPTKCVKAAQDILVWEKSDAYQEYIGFIFAVGDSIKGKKIRDISIEDVQNRVVITGLLGLLDELDKWIDEIPPVEQQQRFGNKAFKDWHSRLEQNSRELVKKSILPKIHDQDKITAIAEEVTVYLIESFGNPTRIDYGTGHEMAFVMFLSCLFMVGVLDKDNDRPSVGLIVFDKYMKLVRKLQNTYRMEPAGSQGVWALDDYQFVAFIWGAAQMIGNRRVKPKSISDYEIADMLAPDYHFFACIKHISTVKTGPFAEHSNQLWNVSGVPLWDKVYTGLIKMYRAEVLSKFPVIQHTFFGSLFTLHPAKNNEATKRIETGLTGTTTNIPRANLPQCVQTSTSFPVT